MIMNNFNLVKEALTIIADVEVAAMDRTVENAPIPPEEIYTKCDEKAQEIINKQKGTLPTKKVLTILYGKGYHSKPLSPKMRQVIAILVAAAMLLTSCAIIYRDEIHEFIEEITEHFTRIKHSDEAKSDNTINEIYEFTYIPEGYTLEKSYDNPLLSKNIFCNSEGDVISLSQFVSDNTIFFIDDENYITILELDMCDVYYKTTNGKHYYLWIFDKYTFELEATKELSNDDLSSVIISAKSK